MWTVTFFFSSRRRHTRYWRDWSSDVCSSDLHRYPHNIALLRDVRREGYPTALATQSHREQALRELEILGLKDEVDVILTREDVEHGKPDPEMHLLAARELGVRPGEFLAIEDSRAGVRGALAAGRNKADGVTLRTSVEQMAQAKV